MQILKQSTAVDVLIGPFVDSGDGVTTEELLTLSQADIKLSKNGQALAQKSDNTAAAHDDDGYYNCELDATDTNTVGTLVLIVNKPGALAVRHEFQVVEEAVYDALFAASAPGFATVAALTTVDTVVDRIEVDTQDIQSRLPSALVSGRMSSDAVAISGSTDAADNLEASALGIITGSAETGTLSTTAMTTDLEGYDNDRLIGRVIVFTSSPLAGEATEITDYAATNGLLTFSTITEAPTNGTKFVVV